MRSYPAPEAPTAPPRIALLGTHVSSLGGVNSGLSERLAAVCDVHAVPTRGGVRGWLPALRAGASAIAGDGCELAHIMDPALAPVGLLLRARYGVPISMTLDGVRTQHRPAPAPLGIVRRFDQVFVSDLERARELIVRLKGPAIAHARAGATDALQAGAGVLASYERAFKGVGPGRLVVGVLWPSDREHLRWFRDAVAPLLHGEPMCLLLGAPGTRDARHLFGARAMKRVRVRTARVSSAEIVAASRFADVFVVPGAMRGVSSQSDALLALIQSGVPVLAGGGVQDDVLEHERNSWLVDPGDAMGLASTLNKLLLLPALQRHYLGQDFAAHARAHRTWDEAAQVYADRFAALVGRPRIPVELKAAA